MTIEKVKNRIRKLLNVADNDAATEGEIANALQFAAQMMAKHNLTREDVTPNGDGVDLSKIQFGKRQAFCVGRRLSAWEAVLAAFICELFGTVDYYSERITLKDETTGRPLFNQKRRKFERSTVIYFFGPDDDCADALEMFEELGQSIAAMAKLRFGTCFVRQGASYAEGFVNGLCAKLNTEVKKLATQDSKTGGLIALADERAVAIRHKADEWLESTGVELVKTSGSRGVNAGFDNWAYNEGKRDGENSEVTKPERTKKLETIERDGE